MRDAPTYAAIPLIERSIMDDSQNAQPLTCSAPPGVQARIVSQADGMPSEPLLHPGPLPEGEGESSRIRCANYGKITNVMQK